MGFGGLFLLGSLADPQEWNQKSFRHQIIQTDHLSRLQVLQSLEDVAGCVAADYPDLIHAL